MKITAEEGRQIVWEDHEDWKKYHNTEEILDQTRWSTILGAVFLHKPTQKTYSIEWSTGSTEIQDERPFEYSEPELTEVEEKEVLVKQWVSVDTIDLPDFQKEIHQLRHALGTVLECDCQTLCMKCGDVAWKAYRVK